MEQKQQMNINIDSSVKPLYADEVAITCTIKQEKNKDGKITKEGTVSFVFVDVLSQSAVSRITISKTTAKALSKILNNNLEELEKKLQNKNEEKQEKVSSSTSNDYIG